MKKSHVLRKALAILSLASLLAACTPENKEPQMMLTRLPLTKEEQEIIALVKPDQYQHVSVYDYQTDGSIQSMEITSYQLDPTGKWVEISGSARAVDIPGGRFSLCFSYLGEGYRTAFQDGPNISAHEYFPSAPAGPGESERKKMSTTTLLGQEGADEAIESEKPIPMAIQVISSQSKVGPFSLDDFEKPEELSQAGHEAVFAITAVFSESPLS